MRIIVLKRFLHWFLYSTQGVVDRSPVAHISRLCRERADIIVREWDNR
jgi:hypothetical protein